MSGNVTINAGKAEGTTGRYFDIYPSGCNWGDIKLHGPEGGDIGLLKVSFHKDDSNSKFTLECKNGSPQTFKYDLSNGFVTGSGTPSQRQRPDVKLIYPEGYSYCTKDDNSDLAAIIPSGTSLFSGEIEYSSSPNGCLNNAIQYMTMKGNVEIKILWPAGYGMTGTYRKNFVFYEEVRK